MLFFYNSINVEAEAKQELKRHRRNLRYNTDPLALTDTAYVNKLITVLLTLSSDCRYLRWQLHYRFVNNFRISKSIFMDLLDGIDSSVDTRRAHGISKKEKLTACIIFFASGRYQHGVGKDFHVAMAPTTFSKVLRRTLRPLHSLVGDWINLRMTQSERQEAKEYFFLKSGIENVVMCVDGTHVKIKKPQERPLTFLNRKSFYSINTLIVCDHKTRIRAVDARFAGSHHYAHIWRVSIVRKYFQRLHRSGQRDKILGDAGYPSEPWLVRPHRDPDEGSAEAEFNKKYSSGRMIVEQTIGVWKSRFRCLAGTDRALNYDPKRSGLIINTCCALHNICIENNIEWQQTFTDLLEDI
ncbi:putative nuclease HARBI1 isoform X1 [Anopheles gambiae]|uniref:putative nuclease HARBI1 isoform X1 n=1 Tax=Anopheles gambiae TaxID=7165 RepID=UPI002AC8C4EF|nr:putative nuclease HARBI1 isoform X1 [Anopheles gambiae]